MMSVGVVGEAVAKAVIRVGVVKPCSALAMSVGVCHQKREVQKEEKAEADDSSVNLGCADWRTCSAGGWADHGGGWLRHGSRGVR